MMKFLISAQTWTKTSIMTYIVILMNYQTFSFINYAHIQLLLTVSLYEGQYGLPDAGFKFNQNSLFRALKGFTQIHSF